MKIKTISSNEKRGTAMVVLIQPNPAHKGQNTSETRHLQLKSGGWQDAAGNRYTQEGNSFKMQGDA